MGRETQRHVSTVPGFPGTPRALQVPQTASPLLGPCRGVPVWWQLCKPAMPFPSPLGTCPELENPDYPVSVEGRVCTAPGRSAHPRGSSAVNSSAKVLSSERTRGTMFSKTSWPSTPKEPKINPPPKNTGHVRHFQPSQGSHSRPEHESMAAKKHQDRSQKWHQRCPNDTWTQA